jgi:hypothetical protein
VHKKILLVAVAATLLLLVPQHRVLADSTGTTFTITVVNDSSAIINNFRVADYETGDYSPDLLGATQTIDPGDSASLTFTEYRSDCNFRVRITTYPVGDASGATPTYSILEHNFCEYPTISLEDASQ